MLVTLRVQRIKYEVTVHRCSFYIHSLHLNISMHILYTVFHTFLGVDLDNLFTNQELP